jgi:hypothetical protein
MDFGEQSMWVIAQLSPDGSTTWWSIPEGWRVVASDVWGTVLSKQDGEQLQLAMAEFAEAPPMPDESSSAGLSPVRGGQTRPLRRSSQCGSFVSRACLS